KYTRLGITPNNLPSSKAIRFHCNSNVMSFLREFSGRMMWEAWLHFDNFIAHPFPAWSVKCCLWIESKIDSVHQYLNMTLWHHVSTHHPKWTNSLLVFC